MTASHAAVRAALARRALYAGVDDFDVRFISGALLCYRACEVNFGAWRVHVVKADYMPTLLRKGNQLFGHSRWNRLAAFVKGDVALAYPQLTGEFNLRDADALSDRKKCIHATNISRPDASCQQSDCLLRISLANIVCRMPAKPLTDEQQRDAARLKAAFKVWQSARRDQGLPSTQEEVVEELFGYKQSAFSQYLNGTIPLNARALQKICAGMGVSPKNISPQIVSAQNAMTAALETTDRLLDDEVALAAQPNDDLQIKVQQRLQKPTTKGDIQAGARPVRARRISVSGNLADAIAGKKSTTKTQGNNVNAVPTTKGPRKS